MMYFNYEEFDSPDQPGSGSEYMNYYFLTKLDIARGYAGIPFNITSGYRTEEHNKKVGGVENSSHVKGLAADIAYTSDKEGLIIIWALAKAGFDRIGLAKTFIHVDDDTSKPSPAFWTYPS